jgi:uncharacterized SAM-binding protein YcdF (DUF218 family)
MIAGLSIPKDKLMFVLLSKILPLFVYPLGLTFLLTLTALIFHRHVRLSRLILGAAVLVLWMSSTSWISLSLARSLEWRYLPQENYPIAELIVVLGGGTEPSQPPRPMTEINSAGDRVLYAAYLYHLGKAEHLLLSGGNLDYIGSRLVTPAEDMAELLAMLAVPSEALLLQPYSRNTYEDALFSAQMAEDMGIKRVLLVTSALHMPRSVALFEAQGLEVIPAPTDFNVTEASWQALTTLNPTNQLLGLFPTVGNLGLTTASLKEYIGMLAYWMRGWI